MREEPQAARTDEPAQFPITMPDQRTILLAETTPPGHLYLHEVVEDPDGKIAIQFPGDTAPKTYRVEGWRAGDPAGSSSRVSFYDRMTLRPMVGQWQVWRFVNSTGDTHPMHTHQSQFQPLNSAGSRLAVTDAGGTNLYNPETRTTSAPLVPDPQRPPRTYEPSEVHGWNDVIRVDPGNVVEHTAGARLSHPPSRFGPRVGAVLRCARHVIHGGGCRQGRGRRGGSVSRPGTGFRP